MKKIIIITICVLLTGLAHAQTYFNGARADYDSFFQPRVGFTLGVAFSNTVKQYQSNFNTGALPGFNAGFTFDFPVSHTLVIAPEILYAQKGYAATTPNGGYTQRSQYVDIPVLAKFRSGSVLNFYVGPQVSYQVSSANSYNHDFVANTRDFYKYSGNKFFYAGVVGAGFDINRTVDIHARYAIDFQGTHTNGNNYVPSYRNQALQVSLGFKFN
jgi:hypothetical protein